MSESRKHEMKVFMELDKLLTPAIIETLANALNIPSRIMEDTENKPVNFLNALRNWEHFNPAQFDTALQGVGGSILSTARKLDWLCNPLYKRPAKKVEQLSAKTLSKLLTNEMRTKEWMILVTTSCPELHMREQEAIGMLKLCIDKSIISKDMQDLCESLQIVERNDLAVQVQKYSSTFQNMSNTEFRQQMYTEISCDISKDSSRDDWQFYLKQFIRTQSKDVVAVLDEAPVHIDTIYTPLTIIKIEPAKEKVGEESGDSEIDFLRKMHDNVAHDTVEVVDFEKIVTNFNASLHEVWSLIGSPGSGKSFLCQHYAHMYGTHQLPNFLYTVSIPCRNQEWHRLEEARHEGEKAVDSGFIVSWLSLSMSIGAKWSESLSEFLVKSDGEGLLIIVDGADEFTRKVPFEATLLCQLLRRRFLSLSTVLVTSRPGSWSDILFEHGAHFHIDANFQVLGFSPTNRDLYFAKRIDNSDKLSAVHQMFARHDEIKQLSLVPVNASLFSALFNQSKSILSQTLSHLYLQLVTYIIRRQLSRMNLHEHSKVQIMSDFHPDIRECINAIGQEANQGIFERKLTSDKIIPLKIGDKVFRSERLGLMQAHIKVTSPGKRVTVWTFQHLTIQEFMAAISTCSNSWTNQCFIVRYITSSSQYVAMYKMVVRFIAGILRQDAGRITPILCRHVLPEPMSLLGLPMVYQLYFFINLVDISDWREFTQTYILLCTVISEINTDAICDHFAYFKEAFSYPLYLYFLDAISPNEWHCFLQSLRYVKEFQILYIRSDFVSCQQFHCLLALLTSCSLHYLVLSFDNTNFDTIHSYTELLPSATLPPNTRISINLFECDLTDNPTQTLFSSIDQFAGSLMLYDSVIQEQTLQNLTNQFSLLENLFYMPNSDDSDWSIIHQLIITHQVNGLLIRDLNGYLPLTPSILLGISSLQELDWFTKEDTYQVVPYLSHLSSLTYLQLFSYTTPPPNESLRDPLTNIISTNSSSLQQINLNFLHTVGFDSWSSFFSCVASCSNLLVLYLYNTEFSSEDISCWYRTVSALKSLVVLFLYDIPLQDSGMLVVCHSLSYHRAIRRLRVKSCKLSSASCRPLICLIQTLRYMRLLALSKPELSDPDPTQLQLLLQTAEECSVKFEFV